MVDRIRRHLTYSNVMVTVLAFVVLGGGAYAALRLPAKSVGTRQLKKNAVVGSKVRDNAMTGNDINEASLVGLNAAKLNGNSSSDFAPADRIVKSPRVAINDDSGIAGPTETPMVTSGPFDVKSRCEDTGASFVASFRVSSDETGTVAANDTGGGYTWGSPGYLASDFADLSGGGPAMATEHLSVVAPSGATLHLDLFAAINVQATDCVFAAFGTGA